MSCPYEAWGAVPDRIYIAFVLISGRKEYAKGSIKNLDGRRESLLTGRTQGFMSYPLLHYGLRVFEGIRSAPEGRAALLSSRLKEHVDRLFSSAHIYQMKIPFTREEIQEAWRPCA